MRNVILIILFSVHITSFAQLKEGFDPEETRDMIAICNSFSYLKMYGQDTDIVPSNYKKTYTSETIGMDNKFQVYVSGNTGVINFRGSTAEKISWLENFHSAMIPASGKISIDEVSYKCEFSLDTAAAVHGGFALATVFMQEEIIKQIKKLNQQGIYHIILTGHSQGGALSQMFRAYLELAKGSKISDRNVFKTYAFASPKIGNAAFVSDYNTNYCNGWSFNIINPKDMVPTFPLSYNDKSLFTKENMVKIIFANDSIGFKDRLVDESIRRFESSISSIFNTVGSMVSDEISKDVAKVEMPDYEKDFNYGSLDELIRISPVQYPLVLKDSTILDNDSLIATYPLDENGFFENKKLYQSEPMLYQHKPYNYYVSILKQYFPKEYADLEKKWYVKN